MNLNKNNYLSTFACCVPVKGYSRAIIYDLEEKNYYIVPLSLVEVFYKASTVTIEELYSEFDEEEHEILNEYIEFGINNNILFECSKEDLERYPKLNLEFDSPYSISNSIIERNNFCEEEIKNILHQLDLIRCSHIQFVFLENISLQKIETILKFTEYSPMETIEFIIPYKNEILEKDIKKLININARLNRIIYYNSPDNSYKSIGDTIITYVNENIDSSSCGKIHQGHFLINMPFFTESQLHNTCLNSKVCIDKDGEIKNCPSMKESFGNIKSTTLQDVIDNKEFKSKWHINKDRIDTCKDCEYKYMCSDCRVFTKNPEHIYSQPSKCNYNPYICKWEGEKGYVPIEDCGDYSEETAFTPNEEKILRFKN